MSRPLNSPTARLLQSSRLFSIPKPLPQPNIEAAAPFGGVKSSDTATLPYPTHQAITTPASSLFRGDFGLKRSLPAKTTRHTSTPHIKIKAQDNFAHITDFESAANHTLTEAKWRQMSIPLTTASSRNSYTRHNSRPKSVYDDSVDNVETPSALSTQSDRTKWKFKGPWIAGMSEGEFQILLSSKIEPRKEEFIAFLKERILARQIRNEEQSLRAQGLDPTLSPQIIQTMRSKVDTSFDTELKTLREEHAMHHLGSDLTTIIREFLDLPSMSGSLATSSASPGDGFTKNVLRDLDVNSNSPPSTHPAAGLSHIRSNAFMENHPLYGPQSHKSPVLARVLRPRSTFGGSTSNAKLGVGGIVTNDPVSKNYTDIRMRNVTLKSPYLDAEKMTHQLDVDLHGGNKIWVHPESAYIDERGSIRLEVSRGDQEAIAVKTGDVDEILQARASAGVAGQGSTTRAGDVLFASDNKKSARQTATFPRRLSPKPYIGGGSNESSAAKISELLSRSMRNSPKH